MLWPIRLLLVVLLLISVASARAAENPMPAVHADRWADATTEAAGYADPVAAKLVRYFRLLSPGQAGADEIAAFIAENPDWPNQAVLERRRQEAVAATISDEAVLAPCLQTRITMPATLARCALALGNGNAERAAADARAAWIAGYSDSGARPIS